MKLLLYSHFFAPSIGGVETIVLSLARGLAGLRSANCAAEFELTIATQTPAGDFDDRTLPFRVIRQPRLVHLWGLIRAADVIHVAGPSLTPVSLARLARKPVVIEHHGYQAICPNGILVYQPDGSNCPGHFQAGRYGKCLHCQECQTHRFQSLASLLLMFPRFWLARSVAQNLFITQHVLKRHALPRSSAVYYGIEDALGRDLSPLPVAITSGKICFAYVGRFVPEKGIPILLQAVQKLIKQGHQFEVRLIGDGPERPELEAFVAREHLESCVRITGYLINSALTDALRDVHVVVMPSIWEETGGLAAIEQMMRGRLVIVSDIGGLGEVVGEAGLRCAPGNVDALADRMREVLQSPTLIDSFGRKARERALRLFKRGRMIDEHAEVYRGMIRERKG